MPGLIPILTDTISPPIQIRGRSLAPPSRNWQGKAIITALSTAFTARRPVRRSPGIKAITGCK